MHVNVNVVVRVNEAVVRPFPSISLNLRLLVSIYVSSRTDNVATIGFDGRNC